MAETPQRPRQLHREFAGLAACECSWHLRREFFRPGHPLELEYSGPDNLGINLNKAEIANPSIRDVVYQWVPPKAILGTEYDFFEAPGDGIKRLLPTLWRSPPNIDHFYLNRVPRWLFRHSAAPAIIYGGPYRFSMAHLTTIRHQYGTPQVRWANLENLDFGDSYGLLPWNAVELGFDGVQAKDLGPFLIRNSYDTVLPDGTTTKARVTNYYLAPPDIRTSLKTGSSSPPLAPWVDREIGLVAAPSLSMVTLHVPRALREQALVDIADIEVRSVTLDIHPYTGDVLRFGRHSSRFKQLFLTDPTLYQILTSQGVVVPRDKNAK